MKLTRQRFILLIVGLTVACSLLTFFVKPRPANLEFMTPQQELPNYVAQYPGDTKLSDRIVKSYELAMILVQTPYMQKNYTALECIRRWAREQFAARPDFLHPAVLPVADQNHDTIFGAVGYNMFASLHSLAQEQMAIFLRWRMNDFHSGYAYQTFRSAYFDLFGWHAEPAILLARYENDRAKIGVDVMLWSVTWLAGALAAVVYVLKHRKSGYFASLQRVTACAWLLLAISYFVQAWSTEQASSAMSFSLAALVSIYLFRPVAVVSHEEAGPRLARIRFTPNWIALAVWLTITVLAVQVLTWIRHTAAGATDPVTMLIGSITGNFLHDPVHGKRLVTAITSAIWVVTALWTWRQQSKTYEPEFDSETSFNELDAAVSFERIR